MKWLRARREARRLAEEQAAQRQRDAWMAFWAAMHHANEHRRTRDEGNRHE